MPTDLGPEYSPDWMGYPPHMSAEDVLIWRRWFPTVRRTVRRMWFDVGLGPPPVIPPKTTVTFEKMWTRLNQKRADVLLDVGSALWIVELRYNASASALGRLALYGDLWGEDPAVSLPVKLYLVTDRLDRSLVKTATRLGIVALEA